MSAILVTDVAISASRFFGFSVFSVLTFSSASSTGGSGALYGTIALVGNALGAKLTPVADPFLNESADIFVFLALNLGSAAFLFYLTFLISC